MMLRKQPGGPIPAEDFGEYLYGMVSALDEGSFETPLRDCAVIARDQMREEFAGEHDAEGQPWEPWHFSPIKDASALGKKTMQHEGNLLASYTQEGAPGNVTRIDQRSLELGSSVVYAGIHDKGATISTGVGLWSRGGGFFLPAGSQINIPARPVAGWSEETLERCEDVIVSWVLDEVFV